VAAALNDESGMQRELQWAASKPLGAVGTLGYAAVGRMAYLGKFKKAHELSAQALRVAKENNFKDVAAGIAAFEGLIEAWVAILRKRGSGSRLAAPCPTRVQTCQWQRQRLLSPKTEPNLKLLLTNSDGAILSIPS